MRRRDLVGHGLGAALGLGSFTARAAEPGVTDGEIVFGQSAVLSGPLGQQILAFNGGVALALNDVNAAGGVAGRQIRLVSLEDELKPDRAVANYRALLQEQKVCAMFGCVGSATTAAAEAVLRETAAPMFGGYAVADSAREKARGAAYFLRSTYGREAEALVQQLATIGLTRIALAHLDNPGGAEVKNLFEKSLQAQGRTLAAAPAVAIDGSNAAQAAATLAKGEPQAVVMFLGAPLAAGVMEASWALGMKPAFYGMSIVAGEAVAKKLGERTRGLAIAQVVPFPWSPADPAAREFQRLSDAAKQPVNYYAFEGYVNARLLVEALKRAGRDLSRARLHAAIRSMKLRYAGMEIDFTGGGPTGSRFIELVQVTTQGRFVR